jgi:cytochrome c biogenesis protein
MRTALILLFLLAVAAVPGSLLPQRDLNPSGVTSYIATHGAWGQFLNHVGMFDVFGSAWFAAIYLLLFISLIGCLIPRIRLHARAVARKPLPAPRNLDRLPESGRFETADDPDTYATAARAALGRRWRIVERAEPSGAITLSAEKGYSRETGNLLFHVALVIALVLVAVGRLYNYQGSVVVSQGSSFCSAPGNFDSWKPGRFASEGKVRPAPLCLTLNKFTADYTSSGEASEFNAQVVYGRTLSTATHATTIKVNHPLRIGGDRVYLIGHGYSPEITVKMPNGRVITDTQPFAPENPTTFYSEGAFKEPGPGGQNQDVGISAFFAPTPVTNADGTVTSASPTVSDPVLGVMVYEGTLFPEGLPESIYTLDTSGMKQLGAAADLTVGQTKTFGNGVTVTFNGWVPWVSIQVNHDPAQSYLLVAAGAMVLGLFASLGIRRRRVWLRITPSHDPQDGSPTVVSVGGLARSDSGNFTTEFTGVLERLRRAAAPAHEMIAAGS